jgi:hypothetical protein
MKIIAVENGLCTGLDDYPEETEARLRDLLDQVCRICSLSQLFV